MKNTPIVTAIPYIDPQKLFSIFANDEGAIFLDSANHREQREDTNRYSYIAIRPFNAIKIKNNKDHITQKTIEHPFQYLKQKLSAYNCKPIPNIPPFQGGAAGYFSYDLCHYLEEINYPSTPENTPFLDMELYFYSSVISFDHTTRSAYIVATGFPETTPEKQKKLAETETNLLLKYIDEFKKKQDIDTTYQKAPTSFQLASPISQDTYEQMVEKGKHYILEGDIFEVNLSHRFECSHCLPAHERYQLYLYARESNPAPFSAFLNFSGHQILSFSPERFLSSKDRSIFSRPIKGTTKRSNNAEEDAQLAHELLTSEKNRSENIMIVDLLRNDMSKICEKNSVKVTALCSLATFATVHHLESHIAGRLLPSVTSVDAIEACFPGGSITGAPKVRAMQIIYELEPTARGPYCGSIGFVSFNGDLDTSITIRTLLFSKDKMSYQAGGAVVLDSNPTLEYEETLIKANAITNLFKGECE